jgi:hypothetical protein
VFFVFLGGADSVFGDALFFPCMSKVSNLALTGGATEVCPGVSGLPGGATLTGIKLYDFADFADGFPGVTDWISVLFHPFDDLDWFPSSNRCQLMNQNGGTIAVTTGDCGFYSGILTAPGTHFFQATGNLGGFAAGFTVAVTADAFLGAAGTITAGNIVEYDYTPAVPEPATFGLIGIGVTAMLYSARRRVKRT